MARNADPDQLAKAILKKTKESDKDGYAFFERAAKRSSYEKTPDQKPREWMQRVINKCGGAENFGSFSRTKVDKYLRDHMQYTQRLQAKHEVALKHLHQLYRGVKDK